MLMLELLNAVIIVRALVEILLVSVMHFAIQKKTVVMILAF